MPDQDLVTVSRAVRNNDGLVLGSSSALNLAGALFVAAKSGPGKTIVTFACDAGERSYSKLWNPEFLAEKGIRDDLETLEQMFQRYRSMDENVIVNVTRRD